MVYGNMNPVYNITTTNTISKLHKTWYELLYTGQCGKYTKTVVKKTHQYYHIHILYEDTRDSFFSFFFSISPHSFLLLLQQTGPHIRVYN